MSPLKSSISRLLLRKIPLFKEINREIEVIRMKTHDQLEMIIFSKTDLVQKMRITLTKNIRPASTN
jgi:hypothetical protein